jgi:hypothetical protein
MTKKVFRQEDGLGLRLAGRLVIFLTVISFLGCVAAIPVAVVYYEREHEYIVTVQLPKNADKVYQTAIEVGEEMSTEGKVKVVKREDKKRLIEAESISQPPRKGSYHVISVDGGSSQIIATGERGKYEKTDKALSFEAVGRVAKKLGVKYKVVKVVR